MLPPDGSTLHESLVNAVYVSLNASWSRQWTSLFLKRDIQGGFLWLWAPMTRVERRRVLRNMLGRFGDDERLGNVVCREGSF